MTGGVSEPPTSASGQNRYSIAAASLRRDAAGSASTNPAYLTLVPNNTRASLARLGTLVNTPILVRTNFGSPGQNPGGFIPTFIPPQPSIPQVGGGGARHYRRRHANPPFSSTAASTTGPLTSTDGTIRSPNLPEANDLDGDNNAIRMLSDLVEISMHVIKEATQNASQGLTGAAVGTVLPLPAFFGVFSAYQHFLSLANFLSGQELMDMLLIARHEVGVHAVASRKEELALKLEERVASTLEPDREVVEEQNASTQHQREGASMEPQQQEASVEEGGFTESISARHPINVGSPFVRLVDIGPHLAPEIVPPTEVLNASKFICTFSQSYQLEITAHGLFLL